MTHEITPDMREPREIARQLITAMASADQALAYRQVLEAVNERRHDDELFELVEALARHAAFLASLPGEVLLTLGHDNVPAELVQRFGNRESTLQTVWPRVAKAPGR